MDTVPSIKTKKIKPPYERVPLEPSLVKCLDDWIIQIKERYKFIELTRKQILSWLIESHDRRLSKAEEKAVFDKFLNGENVLEHALKEYRDAKGRGENVALSDLIPSELLKKDAGTNEKKVPKERKLKDLKQKGSSEALTPSMPNAS